ncbi:MAG: Uncharacterised protein [Flavobacterium sp. SCGC AAA160-P02]|nr:MAG: Uncharacterised protein [Flavobacterium sp. SCGC AAA160-P02]|tara:strand:+ start:184 stop:945 length:762 start_codon:yes stop_codon:yes gene_type:complete
MLTFKIVAIFVIALAGVLGGMLPTRPSFSGDGKNTLTLGNAFAGGVFLGAGFLHMLPDGIDNFTAMNTGVDYPLALLTTAIGFLLILLIDKGLSSHDTSAVLERKGSFPLVLFLVLAVHSIIAGMSLGLDEGFLSALVILIAIMAHKSSAAFALGVNMVSNDCDRPLMKKTIWFFAFMTPLGVVLGTILGYNESSESSVMFEGIFDSLAAGTFLYIATLEIISELFEKNSQKGPKIGLIVMGFALMATIAIWT